MSAALKLSVMALVMVAAAATSLQRERRFLLGGNASGAKRLFRPKDEQQTKDLSQFIQELTQKAIQRAAAGYFVDLGRTLYRNASDPNHGKWKAAMNRVTQLGYELLLVQRSFYDNAYWIRFIEDTFKEEDVQKALDEIRDGVTHMEGLLPKVTQALTELQDVVDTSTADDIGVHIRKVAIIDGMMKTIQDKYESLVEATGIDN